MLKDERLEYIERYVNQQRYVSFHELMETLGISKATVRRDLERLCEEDKVSLVRGGAISKNSPITAELPYEQKQQAMVEEKCRVAQAAAELVKPSQSILVDSGTTTRKIVPFLATIPDIHVITCDIAVAADLSYYPNVEVTVIGGTLRGGYFNLTGFFARNSLQYLRADIAFLAIDAINERGDCMITNVEEVETKQQIVQASARNILLCDHTKFGKDAMVRVCRLDDMDMVITGAELSDQMLDVYEDTRQKIMRV